MMRTRERQGQGAVYKGRKYKLLWSGETKYGRRAKLGFFDGSKEFWVAAEAISVVSFERECPDCGCTECGGPCRGPAFDPCFDCR